MKVLRILIISMAMIAVTTALCGQSITVSNPAGGERLAIGDPINITWNAMGLSGNVRVSLVTPDGAMVGRIIGSVAAASGSHSWSVGALLDGAVTAGESYRIRVRHIDSEVAGKSAVFTIIASGPARPLAPELTLMAPNGGQVWYPGETQNITWRFRGLEGVEFVRLSLYKDGRDEANLVGVISHSCAIGSGGVGSMPWNPGAFYTGGPAPVGNDCYYVKVATLDNAMADFSNAPFTIGLKVHLLKPMQRFTPAAAGGPGIEVPSPRAPLTLTHRFVINWAARGVSGNLVINLLTESGGTFTIATGVDPGRATGHFTWTVGQLATGGEHLIPRAGERFRFQVAGAGASGLSGWFEIARPSLRVTEPHSDQRIRRGDHITIRWDAPDLQGDIKIEAQSRNLPSGSFGTYETLAAAAPNDGRREWTVLPRLGGGELDPPPGGDNVRWRILITSLRNPRIIGASDDFIIE